MPGQSWTHHNIGRQIIFDSDYVWVGSSPAAFGATVVRKYKADLSAYTEQFTLPIVLASQGLVYDSIFYYVTKIDGDVLIKTQTGSTFFSATENYTNSLLRVAFNGVNFMLLEYKNTAPEDDVVIRVISTSGALVATYILTQPYDIINIHAFDSHDGYTIIGGINEGYTSYKFNVYDADFELLWTYDTGEILTPFATASMTASYAAITEYDPGEDIIISRLANKATGDLITNIIPSIGAADGYIPNGQINFAEQKSNFYIAWDGLNSNDDNNQGYVVRYKVFTGPVFEYQGVLNMPFQHHFCRGVWADRKFN